MSPFYFRKTIYYADTDAYGVVYHGNYLSIFESARTEALHEIGVSLIDLAQRWDCLFVARRVNLEYLGPLHLEDKIEVETRVAEIRPMSVIYHQTLYRVDQKEAILTKLDLKLACVGKDFKLKNIPEPLVAELSR